MTDTPEDTAGPAEPTAPREVRFLAHRAGILETGEGSLLKTALAATDERRRSKLDYMTAENGLETVTIELASEGGVTVLEPSLFDNHRSKPLYRSGTAYLGSLDSLVDYTNRFKGPCSVVFADDSRLAPNVTTVFDYHSAGAAHEGGQAFGRHQAEHALPLSDQWEAWHDLDSSEITMPNFARFLEDHIVDVLPLGMIELSDEQKKFVSALGGESKIADPAKLMELAQGLRVFEDSQVGQAVNLASGEGEVVFTSAHSDGQGGKLNIPTMFVIAIPVFRHGDFYQIVVRLRYRKSGGITFIYELWRDDLVFDHAFDEAAQRVGNDTSLPVFRGTRGDS